MNIGIDNDIGLIWGNIINKISNSGLVSGSVMRTKHDMWTTRLCKSNFPLEDIACNNSLILSRNVNASRYRNANNNI